ncbi:hypothetical protein B0H13DRAFT_1865936 [Mycena leptocephala]|nr:hypothetical protein B0H13DRAFT_1865936 [Mycena leptocephala]
MSELRALYSGAFQDFILALISARVHPVNVYELQRNQYTTDSAGVMRTLHRSHPVPGYRWHLSAKDPVFPMLVVLMELVKLVESTMSDIMYFLKLGAHAFIISAREIWPLQDLILCLRRRLTWMVGLNVAAVAASMDIHTTSIRGTGTIGFTCAGWGKEWDSDELPELI